ncbi:MAG TPA: metallopeptidase TldD-related protein [Candidatus Nanopelagicales bacterium]
MTVTEPHEMVERALALSDTDDCVVIVSTAHEANLRWARNTLTTNGESAESSVTVIAFLGRGADAVVGSVTRSGLDPAGLPDLLSAARAVAQEAESALDAGPLVSGVPASPDWADPAGSTTGQVFTDVAPTLGHAFVTGAADGIEHFGFASHSVTTTWLGSSSGLRLRHTQPEGRLELTAKSHDRSRSAWTGTATRDFADADVLAMDAELRQRLQWQGRRIEVAPGHHDAVLSPSAVSDLLIDLYWSAIGRDAAEGRSVFSHAGGGTRVDERIAAPGVSLYSDPGHPQLACQPFAVASASSGAGSVFDNGLPLTRTAWIEDGVLTSLIAPRATARDTGLPVAPAVDNLWLEVAGGTGSLEDLVTRTGSGLLVTCLWYNRVVDPQTLLLTGLTRDGVYVVEGGEVVGATSNFRFNDSPVSILGRVADAGATVPTLAREMGDYFNRAAMPPLLVTGYNFSTVSQAS